MLRKLCLSLLLTTVSLASAQNTRHFTFHYGFTVKNVPAGERVRVWFPAAHSDEFQEVKVISANGDLKLKKTRESRFGNEMYYAESSKGASHRAALRSRLRRGASRAPDSGNRPAAPGRS